LGQAFEHAIPVDPGEAEPLQHPACVLGKSTAVDAHHALTAECLHQTRDRGPAQLEAEGHDQHVVVEPFTRDQLHPVDLRLKAGNAAVNPLHIGRKHTLLRPAGLLRRDEATSHQHPARLVVVLRGWLHQGDRHVGIEATQPAGHGDALMLLEGCMP
jgi:hypothetical protein